MNRDEFFTISKKAFRKWQANNATSRSAAIAFFTALSLPSVLLIILGVFTLIYGEALALPQLTSQIASVAGPTIAELVGDLLQNQTNPFTSPLGAFLTAAFAVAGAIGVFVVLRDTFDTLWETPKKKYKNLKERLRARIVPFLMVSSIGFIVVAWTGITNVFFLSINFLLEPSLGGSTDLVLGAFQILLSFALTALLFGIIYKELPDIEIDWTDVILAALLTSIASTILNYIFGIYIITFSATSLVGTAGTVMVLMLWIFLTDEFILFGAQFSKIYTETVGSHFKRAETEALELHKRKNPQP
jgi:membrane protein